MSAERGQNDNEAIFNLRGFTGDYELRFILNGEWGGDCPECDTDMEIELMEDQYWRCDWSDGFDEKICTEI